MNIKVYQICYDEMTLGNVPEGFLALDNLKNERPDWREYWPIRNFLINNYLSDNTLYGFMSPKFKSKTLLDYKGIHSFLQSDYKNQNVVSFSPFWDLISIFKNIFEQGDFFHPGLSHVCQLFANQHLSNIDTVNCITHSQNTIFCNYFLADKRFWLEWLLLGEKLFHCSELNRSDLGNLLNANTSYGDQRIPMKIFVQERLATICLLKNTGFNCLAYSPFNTGPSTTPFNQFYDESILSDSLKYLFSITNNHIYLQQFSKIRDFVISSLKKSS